MIDEYRSLGPTPEKVEGWLWGFMCGFCFSLIGVGISFLVVFLRG